MWVVREAVVNLIESQAHFRIFPSYPNLSFLYIFLGFRKCSKSLRFDGMLFTPTMRQLVRINLVMTLALFKVRVMEYGHNFIQLPLP